MNVNKLFKMVKLTSAGRKELHRILKVHSFGHGLGCPKPLTTFDYNTIKAFEKELNIIAHHKFNPDCVICRSLFPKTGTLEYGCCPCHVYSVKYLVRKIKQVLKNNGG